MSASFAVSESFSPRSIYWSLISPQPRKPRQAHQTAAIAIFSLITLIWALLPDLAILGRSVGVALFWACGLALALGALVFVLSNPMFLVGLAIVGVYAVVMKPRKG